MPGSLVLAGIRSSMAAKAMISSLGESQRVIIRHRGGELSVRKMPQIETPDCLECDHILTCDARVCRKKRGES